MMQTIDFKIPSPTFGGSTGGWLRAAEIEEKYAITWTSKAEDIFEMPTGGAAVMRQGDNLLYLAKKEQCLALSRQLQNIFKIKDFKIYRIFPNGEVQYLHPKDGVAPEKVNPGREGVGNISHCIGKNDNPVNKKFTGKATYE
uniref:Photosystem I reaction center subunit II n=1 Tax=Plocamium cartilagineum TaxID=31452 RepID=A0A1C9CHH3_PLOCA|nr:photosystem I subunit II [Plocamium cartilagineum]AOM67848.1 photosystem I subunit II [Plocamium cartilagineum]